MRVQCTRASIARHELHHTAERSYPSSPSGVVPVKPRWPGTASASRDTTQLVPMTTRPRRETVWKAAAARRRSVWRRLWANSANGMGPVGELRPQSAAAGGGWSAMNQRPRRLWGTDYSSRPGDWKASPRAQVGQELPPTSTSWLFPRRMGGAARITPTGDVLNPPPRLYSQQELEAPGRAGGRGAKLPASRPALRYRPVDSKSLARSWGKFEYKERLDHGPMGPGG